MTSACAWNICIAHHITGRAQKTSSVYVCATGLWEVNYLIGFGSVFRYSLVFTLANKKPEFGMADYALNKE
jgi:hypothetical protein